MFIQYLLFILCYRYCWGWDWWCNSCFLRSSAVWRVSSDRYFWRNQNWWSPCPHQHRWSRLRSWWHINSPKKPSDAQLHRDARWTSFVPLFTLRVCGNHSLFSLFNDYVFTFITNNTLNPFLSVCQLHQLWVKPIDLLTRIKSRVTYISWTLVIVYTSTTWWTLSVFINPYRTPCIKNLKCIHCVVK